MSSSVIFLSDRPWSIQTGPTKTDALYKILKHSIFLKSKPCKSIFLSEKKMDSKSEPMFMNDKQSKLVRSSTGQCKDLPEQKLTGDLTTSVDYCPCTSIVGIYISFIR